jgi:hypothetical protein
MPQGIFDPELLLAYEKAQLAVDQGVGLNSDGQIELRWPIPPQASEELKAWVESKRRTIKKFTVEGRDFSDTWRTYKVEISGIEAVDRNRSVLLRHTLRKGYITTLLSGASIDWTEARWSPLGSTMSPGNASTAGVTNSGSDDPAKLIAVEFRNIAPERAASVCAEFSTGDYSNVVVEDVAVTGTWHRIMQSWRKEDDGSATVTVYLGQPQFTLQSFANLNLVTSEDIYYLWGIPKALAQDIITAWKTTGSEEQLAGRSASASFSADSALVNLILSAKGNPLANLTTDPMRVHCDTVEVHHYAWGYTEEQLETFLAAHGGENDHAGDEAGVDGQQTPLSWSGRSREIKVSQRGDGFFDAIVIETYTEYDADTHVFTLDAWTGNAIERTLEWGWLVPMSRLETVKASFETTTYKGVGLAANIRIDRNDDNCTFNYLAERTKEEPQNAQLVFGSGNSTGVATSVRSARGQTSTALKGLQETITGRERIDADLKIEDNGTATATIVKRTVQAPQKKVDSGADGVVSEASAGRNVDSAHLLHVLQSAARKRVNIDISGNDDGTFDYSCSAVTVKETQGSVSSGSGGIVAEASSGKNVDWGNLTYLLQSAARKRVNLQLSGNDDGTFDYSCSSQTVVSGTDSANVSGTGVLIETIAGRNRDAGTAADVLTLVKGQRASVNLDLNDDGTINFSATKVTPVTTLLSGVGVTRTDTEGVTFKVWRGVNAKDSDFTTALSAAKAGARKAHQITYNPNDEGGIDYLIVETEDSNATCNLFLPAPSAGHDVSVSSGYAATNAELTALVAMYSGAARRRVEVNIDPRADGTFRYVMMRRDVKANTATVSMGEKYAPVSLVVGTDQDKMPAITPPGFGEVVDVDVRPNDDKTFTYSVRRRAKQKFEKFGTGGTYSQRETVTDATADSTTDLSHQPTPGVSYELLLEVNADGTYEWKRIKTERVAMIQSFAMSKRDPWYERAGITKTATAFDGCQLDAFPQPASDYWEYESFVLNADGTCSGVLVSYTYAFQKSDWEWVVGIHTAFEWKYHTAADGSVWRRRTIYRMNYSSTYRGDLILATMAGCDTRYMDLSTSERYGRVIHTSRVGFLVGETPWEKKVDAPQIT